MPSYVRAGIRKCARIRALSKDIVSFHAYMLYIYQAVVAHSSLF